MYLTIIFLPAIGALISSLFTRYIGRQSSIIITTVLMGLCTLLSFFIFYEIVLSHSVCTIKVIV